MSEEHTSEILLKTSSQAAHSSLVGLGAAMVARRSGMPETEADELRRVVDQAMAMLVDEPSRDDDRIITRFFVDDGDRFLMEISRSDEAAVSSAATTHFNEAITDCDIAVVMEPSRSWLRLSKPIRNGL